MPRRLSAAVCRHLVAVGVALLLLPDPNPAAVSVMGGALFGVGFAGWLFHKLAGGPV